MILGVRVIPKAGRNSVKEQGGALKVYLTHAPQEGMANKQLIGVLADYLKIKKYRIRIIRGEKSRDKLVEISDAA